MPLVGGGGALIHTLHPLGNLYSPLLALPTQDLHLITKLGTHALIVNAQLIHSHSPFMSNLDTCINRQCTTYRHINLAFGTHTQALIMPLIMHNQLTYSCIRMGQGRYLSRFRPDSAHVQYNPVSVASQSLAVSTTYDSIFKNYISALLSISLITFHVQLSIEGS